MIYAREDHQGILRWAGKNVGSVSGSTVYVSPDQLTTWPTPTYEKVQIGQSRDGTGVTQTFRQMFSGWEWEDALARFPENGQVTVRYQAVGQENNVTESLQLTALDVYLNRGYAERITQGSLRFTLGGSTFVNTAGLIYRDPSPATGAGTAAGSLDPSTGKITITSWVGGGANAVTVTALTTEVGGQPVDEAIFRTLSNPIKPGAFQLRYMDLVGNVYTKTPDSSGLLEDGDCIIRVDFERGQVYVRFGQWREVSGLTPEEMAQDWYSPLSHVNRAGIESVWKPVQVDASSIIYNAVATTMLPPDSALLGLNAARLPPDGKALIYRTGMLALVHHTASLAQASLSAGEEINCGRTRLYRVVIEDSEGARLPADLYEVDRELGIVTMADPLDLSEYTAPFAIKHTIADLSRVRDTDINGTVTFLRGVSHAYPLGSYLSGMLYCGTLQARISDMFEQTTWTGIWQDTRIGDQPLASYNAAAFPVDVTNAGAYKDRILVKFTSATAFQVIGENMGLIGIGDINTNCEPINPLTGQAYFKVDYRGWGGGWATGNCLRFNLHAASYPVDLVRAVQPSSPTGQSDCVELLLVGNVDA